ncbi:hypothetical protein PVAP13_2KG168700 [Panicum virgatum]|uniref:Uncharacterized protein n=1 Tax=Panicum virgatum TaxID=38727 RepID=A0A8T0W758_PANVG|nr:hypothetical protein PVAP13_2KG168700 [Panicum virgatum]
MPRGAALANICKRPLHSFIFSDCSRYGQTTRHSAKVGFPVVAAVV